MKRCTLFLLSLIAFAVAASAQQPTSVEPKESVFRFYVGHGDFYFPGENNKAVFYDAVEFIDAHRQSLDNGAMSIRVYGYCGTGGDDATRERRVKSMSNYVKGEFIYAKKAVEQNFITTNVIESYSSVMPNAVVVVFGPSDAKSTPVPAPKEVVAPAPKVEPVPAPAPKAEPKSIPATVVEPAQPIEPAEVVEQKSAVEPTEAPVVAQSEQQSCEPKSCACAVKSGKFSLRTNLLYWLAATPNIGFEWKVADNFGVVVNGGYAPLKSEGWNHNFGGWFVAPEVRWYLGEQKRWFAGAQFIGSKFDIKLSSVGRKGSMIGGGIIGGYKMPLSRNFDMDFTLGVGYSSVNYDMYRVANGEREIFKKDLTSHLCLPIQAGVNLIWKIR